MPSISLSPNKNLFLEGDDLNKFPSLVAAFDHGVGHGLLFLDTAMDKISEQDEFLYWKDFARLYLALFAATPNLELIELKKDPIKVILPLDDLSRLLMTKPPMKGGEYLNEDCLLTLWHSLEICLIGEIVESKKGVAEFFQERHSAWNLLGRVCFHLAENKRSAETPFAFLATYAHQLSADGKTQHLPLSRALEEYGSTKQKNILLRLLSPLQKASAESPFLKALVDSGDIYHPIAWTVKETHQFLKQIPVFEKAGISVRVPNWWKVKSTARPHVAIRLGDKKPSGIGFNALLDFSMAVVLGEQELSQKELQDLLSRSENLVFFKGQWVEVDKEKLGDILSKWKKVASAAEDGGISFSEGMRLLSGVGSARAGTELEDESGYARVISGNWLSEMLQSIKSPEMNQKAEKILSQNLLTSLRDYQSQGVRWLHQLNQLKLGAILADDMGLGKTMQIISLLILRQKWTNQKSKALLVVPASLIGNWERELKTFAPSLQYWTAHPSGNGYEKPKNEEFDLAITTYGSVGRLEWLGKEKWDIVIADEAQAIKNPAAKQTKAIKSIIASHKIALTGTPVENRLSDLWSLFDFVSPGLLGSIKDFESYVKNKNKSKDNPYVHIRKLVSPYILRRLKTDKSVINDLPDKTELKSFCQLSKAQAALYQQSVESLARDLEQIDGIKRRGVILSYLMRFKQICNHPAHFVKDSDYKPQDSGKFLHLKELCETISEKQEKLLVFSQFKEMTKPLHDFLKLIFGKSGLILDGDTPIKKRQEMVAQFQQEGGPPFFVLSLKAGGTGLNLTAASHVIHFDRWWNPAVENQATDRAFRIGQKRNVLVHKFICKGTLEEKIDALIESKQSLSKELLDGDGGPILTEFSNEDLLKIVALDINSAVID